MAFPGGGQDPPAPGAVKTAAGSAFAHEGAGGAPAPQPFAPDALVEDAAAGQRPARHGSVHYSGGNEVQLLRGGTELFPAMCAALAAARHEVWLASYIFHFDA